MHRFYVSAEAFGKDEVRLSPEDSKHLTKVLRLWPGDRVILCDGQGNEACAQITGGERDGAHLSIIERRPCCGENEHVRLTLFQGMPKSGKLETIVQKNTELGVCRFVPFFSRYTVVKPTNGDDKKRVRLERVAMEAAKQCGRGILPEVAPFTSFSELPAMMKDFDLVLTAWEKEDGTTLREALETYLADNQPLDRTVNAAVIVGPEGGFTPEEVKRLEEAGAVSVSLGRRILRTETAGMAGAAQINYAFGD